MKFFGRMYKLSDKIYNILVVIIFIIKIYAYSKKIKINKIEITFRATDFFSTIVQVGKNLRKKSYRLKIIWTNESTRWNGCLYLKYRKCNKNMDKIFFEAICGRKSSIKYRKMCLVMMKDCVNVWREHFGTILP